MALQVVGAGFPRTGTLSLKRALERLLGAPCYHAREVFDHVEHAPTWLAAVRGTFPDWDTFPAGYAATVDWPAAWFWRELAAAHPDAVVLLSRRDSADTWYRSLVRTVLAWRRERGVERGLPPDAERPPWAATCTREQAEAAVTLFQTMNDTAFPRSADEARLMATYERHLAEVREAVPAERLVEWQPGDGYAPLCAALGVPVPDEAFPRENSTTAFRQRSGLRPAPAVPGAAAP